MDSAPVEVAALARNFGRRVALSGVDLRVGPGEIVGLVGPNGSGKSTLLRVLAGLLRPDSGRASVFGCEPFVEREQVMRRARFAFAPPALFEALTAREHLRYLSRLVARGSPHPSAAEIEGALDIVGLLDRADDRVRTFSLGMRQRLALAQALLPRPDLLVLDEPTEGLDPLAVLELRAILARLSSEHGTAILLSSHLLVEIDELVDHMLVLHEGKPLFAGTPAELCRGTERTWIDVDHADQAAALLAARGLDAHRDAAGRFSLAVGDLDLAAARDLLHAGGVELRGFHVERPSLESALLARLRQEKRA